MVYDDHVDKGAAHDVTPWDYVTNIAAYDKNADGAYSLSKVENLTNRYYYGAHELDMASFKDGDIKDKDLDVSDNHSGDNRTGVEALERVNATDLLLSITLLMKPPGAATSISASFSSASSQISAL